MGAWYGGGIRFWVVHLILSWDLQRTRGPGVDEGIWNNGCDWLSSAESGVKGGQRDRLWVEVFVVEDTWPKPSWFTMNKSCRIPHDKVARKKKALSSNHCLNYSNSRNSRPVPFIGHLSGFWDSWSTKFQQICNRSSIGTCHYCQLDVMRWNSKPKGCHWV